MRPPSLRTTTVAVLLILIVFSLQERLPSAARALSQFQDLCRLFDEVGVPSETSTFIFNGDFVDRGAWGVETVSLLFALKVALPKNVFLLRGNHETTYSTTTYGFREELRAKFKGPSVASSLYRKFLRAFTQLPLGAHFGRTFVFHGGLFQKDKEVEERRSKARSLCHRQWTRNVSLRNVQQACSLHMPEAVRILTVRGFLRRGQGRMRQGSARRSRPPLRTGHRTSFHQTPRPQPLPLLLRQAAWWQSQPLSRCHLLCSSARGLRLTRFPFRSWARSKTCASLNGRARIRRQGSPATFCGPIRGRRRA